MATIKSFTDLEQSKKLAEILPLESADMGWNVFVDGTVRILPIDDWDLVKDGSGNVKFYPAWSLAALLDVLKDGALDFTNSRFRLYSNGVTKYMDNPVDACYEMIIHLHEFKML